MTCKECLYYEVCPLGLAIKGKTGTCLKFKNKADFVEVVRCGKCKHGDVSIIRKSKDGEETVACYCNLEGKVCSLEWYCPNGERKDAE